MKRISLYTFVLAALFMITACGGESPDVVESGTYVGVVDKVEAEKSEIYVETKDGKRLELYFVEETVLVQGSDTVAFDNLAKGQQVEVTLEKVGKRLDPMKVIILD